MAMEIFTVGRGQEGYPERLMPFADMPSRLFVRGALPADEQKTAAIVGARICTAYGKSQAAFFAQVLAANGVKAWIYKELMPVPCLSFAVRHLKCSAGVMVRSSATVIP